LEPLNFEKKIMTKSYFLFEFKRERERQQKNIFSKVFHWILIGMNGKGGDMT